jgi:dihydrodipicolinate synthase/N-acetylneuraminate lyase
MTTAGTSQYNLLARSEILEFNRTIARQASEHGLRVIMGVPPLSTTAVFRFMEAMRALDVYAFMVMWPDRFRTIKDVIDWILRLEDSALDTPLWLHAKPVRRNTGGIHTFSASDLEALHGLARLAGVKEESMDSLDLPYQISCKAHPGFTVCLAGGSMRRGAVAAPDHNVTWLAGIGSFFPGTEVEARKAWLDQDTVPGRLDTFRRIQHDIEDPAFECASRVGWHPFMRAVMAHIGMLPPHQRAPFEVGPDAMAAAKVYLKRIGEN